MSRKELWQASYVFAPDFPRRSTDAEKMQGVRDTRPEFVAALEAATHGGMPGYYTVYSFPRGHPQSGYIPKVDCIFIDLDITRDHYNPDEGRTQFEAWRADMSALLARARMIGDAIIEAGMAEHFRVVLSGHKGIHLYLDFAPITPAEGNGNIGKFKAGLKAYGDAIMAWLDDLAGGINIQPWVDVDGSDLARLARHPNTIHHGAAYDDETRWAVPITVQELADLHWEDYLSYTKEPRWPSIERVPSESAHNKAVQNIRQASASSTGGGGARKTAKADEALDNYRDSEHVNDALDLEDVLFLTKDKPCFRAFRERDDAYSHGEASRTMELSIMGRLLDMGAPVATIHAFLEPIPGYDEATTNEILGDLLARGNEYGEFNCETICTQSPQFCLGDSCAIYRRSPDLTK